MVFNVPQFIDVEDKVAGPLTWKQILWMIGLGAILFTCYNIFEFAFFFIVGIPVTIFFVLMAFYRPGGISMLSFTIHGVFFLLQPKVAVWERPVRQRLPTITNDVSAETKTVEHTFDPAKAKELARLMDAHKE